MSGIVVNKEIINGGNIPFISSGRSNPAALSRPFVDNELYFWTDNQSWWGYSLDNGGWVLLSGGGGATPTLQQVLAAGNNTDISAEFDTGTNITIIQPTGLTVAESAISTEITTQGLKIKWASTGNTVYQLLNYPTFTSCFQYITPKQGYTLIGQTGKAALINGTVIVNTYIDLDVFSTYVFGLAKQNGTLGVQYLGEYLSIHSFRITSIKTNGTVETSDQSDVYFTIAQRIA